MAMGGRGDGSMLSEINVTPLVDVMLVLLIIFMVTAPMLEQGVDIDLPHAEAQAMEAADKKLVLSVDAKRRIFLGKTFIPYSQLFDKLRHNAKLQADKELYLRAERTLPYGLIVKIMALARSAGIENVGMITESAPDDVDAAETQAGVMPKGS